MNFHPLNIILINEENQGRNILIRAIERTKIKTELSLLANCDQLIEYLEKKVQQTPPNLIIVDMEISHEEGMKCVQEIRKNTHLANVVIAVYSNTTNEKIIQETFVEGANIFIQKPNSYKKLIKVIDEVLRVNWQYYTSGLNRENFFLKI